MRRILSRTPRTPPPAALPGRPASGHSLANGLAMTGGFAVRLWLPAAERAS